MIVVSWNVFLYFGLNIKKRKGKINGKLKYLVANKAKMLYYY